MLHDLLRPSAIVTHLLVLAVAVTCIALGQWQLDRLRQVRDHNGLLEERLQAPPLDLATLVDSGDGASHPADEAALEFRRVEATGIYRTDEEVLQRNRDHHGQQGFHVLTPLELTDGGVVLVRRGWVPAELSEPPVAEADPGDSEVVVHGLLERPVAQPGFGARDPDDGHLERVFHADTARLDRQVAGDLFPMVLRAEQDPPLPPGEFPVGLEAPVLDEANHLSYAVQWHTFGVIALVTYGFWLRSRLRRNRADRDAPPDDDEGGGGGTPRLDPVPDRPPAGVAVPG